ncbi:MAG: hypothetical protein ABL984_00510 [Pyrinomonadaceae bacterium]
MRLLSALISTLALSSSTFGPLDFTEYGFPWERRLGTNFGLGSPFGGTVTRYTSSGFPDCPFTRRIGLDGESASCGIKLNKSLGYGDYEVWFSANLAALDPTTNTAVWLYDDLDASTKGNQEIDAEFSRWSDTNNPYGVHLGVFDKGIRFGSVAKFLARPARYWRVKLRWGPKRQQIFTEAYQENHAAVWDPVKETTTVTKTGRWISTGEATFDLPSPKIGATLRIAIAQNSPPMFTLSNRARSKVIVCGVRFTPAAAIEPPTRTVRRK